MLKTRLALGLLILCVGATVQAQGPTALSGTWDALREVEGVSSPRRATP